MWGIARNCANRQQVNTNEVKCGNLKIHQYIYHLWLAWLPEFLSFSLLLLRKLVSSSSSHGLVFILQLGRSISQQIPFSTYACSCAPGESQHITLIIFNKWVPCYNYAIRRRWSAHIDKFPLNRQTHMKATSCIRLMLQEHSRQISTYKLRSIV